jgi:hypothetical protein
LVDGRNAIVWGLLQSSMFVRCFFIL